MIVFRFLKIDSNIKHHCFVEFLIIWLKWDMREGICRFKWEFGYCSMEKYCCYYYYYYYYYYCVVVVVVFNFLSKLMNFNSRLITMQLLFGYEGWLWQIVLDLRCFFFGSWDHGHHWEVVIMSLDTRWTRHVVFIKWTGFG